MKHSFDNILCFVAYLMDGPIVLHGLACAAPVGEKRSDSALSDLALTLTFVVCRTECPTAAVADHPKHRNHKQRKFK